MGIGKLAKSKQLLGISVAAVLLTVIFVPFQQASAFTVTVDLPNSVGGEITNSVAGEPFEIAIDVEAGELISIANITLILDNGDPSLSTAIFDSDGDRIGGGGEGFIANSALNISASTNDYGYSYGFGSVSDGITGFAGNTYSITSTDGFIGGNAGGSNNPGVTNFVTGLLGPATITITGNLRTANLAAGTHTLDVLINTGAGTNPDILTIDPAFAFDVVEDDTIVVVEEPVGAGVTTADIVTTNTNGDPINIRLNFDATTGAAGNAIVVVQSTAEFLAANTPEELAAQGFQESTSLTFVTDDTNTSYAPVGFIMDLDLSALGLPDGTKVTLEMTYDDTGLDDDEELDVRLMHQLDDLSGWEVLSNDDATINGGDEVDIVANLVYGTTDDFSLFAPAAGSSSSGGGGGDDDDDGGSSGGGGGGGTVTITWPGVDTLPADHFINFPLEKIQVGSSAFVNAGGVSINSAQVNQQVSIAGEFTNYQETPQDYAFIVQVTDEDGFVTDIAWQQGTLNSGSTVDVSTLWTPETDGTFTVKIFVWNGISAAPEPLSEVTVKNISVTG